MSLLDEITLDDLDEKQRELAECIGLDAYKKLVSTYAGEPIAVRMPEGITRNIRNKKIRAEFTGYNVRELSKKYRLHENTIRDIVSDIKKEKQFEPIEGQINFWDDE